MSAQTLNGREVSDALLARVAGTIEQAGRPNINLVTVVVGHDPRSRLYINLKLKKAHQVGMGSRLVELPETVSQAELEEAITTLSNSDDVHGILLQLP